MAYTYKKKCKLQLEKGEITLTRFLWGRMRNVYPLLLLTLLITTGLQFLYKNLTGGWFYVESVTIQSFLMSLLNVSSGWFIIDNNLNMPVWYFFTLMLCYILYYCILKFSKKDYDLYQILCLLMVIIGIRAFIVPVWQPFLYENTARGYYCFFLGVLLYDIYIYHNKTERIRDISANIMLLAFVLIAFLVYEFGADTLLGNHQLIWGALLSPMVVWIALNSKLLNLLFSSPKLSWMGKISTSIYFWHFIGYQIIRIIAEYINLRQYYSSLWFYFAVVFFIVVISVFSCFIIEPRITFKGKATVKKVQ